MRFHIEAREDAYDAIVIGSGVGGLVSAAMLARLGRKVLVVERHDRPGGYLHSFRRDGCLFDSAVHLVGGCGETERGPGIVQRLLRSLDIADQCTFERVDPFYSAVFPGFRLDAQSGIQGFTEAHVEKFPAEKAGFEALIETCSRIRAETELASQFEAGGFRSISEAAPTLFRHRRSTLEEVSRSFLEDPRARAAFGALWPYLGLPPSRVSFLYFATMLMSYVEDGAYYCKGSFQNLAHALVSGLKRDGGELLLRSEVRRIRVENGAVAGVVLENGQRIDAPLVISGADALQTFEELIGYQHLDARFVRSLGKMRLSLSAFVVYGSTGMDLPAAGATHEMFLYDTWDHDDDYAALHRGEISRIGFTVPTLADASLAPAGRHAFQITVPIPFDFVSSWKNEKQRLTDHLIGRADHAFPGLQNQLGAVLGGTPRTLERYTRNTHGAMYGWELAPDQIGPRRLGGTSPVAGLLLAGHWTQPGAGVYGALTSGVDAARRIAGAESDEALWRQLDAA